METEKVGLGRDLNADLYLKSWNTNENQIYEFGAQERGFNGDKDLKSLVVSSKCDHSGTDYKLRISLRHIHISGLDRKKENMTETEKIISNDLWEHNISGMV